jgi:hypothetical protein
MYSFTICNFKKKTTLDSKKKTLIRKVSHSLVYVIFQAKISKLSSSATINKFTARVIAKFPCISKLI